MKLQIIIGSSRQGRQSDRLGAWVYNEAKTLEGVEVELVDLKDYQLPVFDEAISPRFNPDRKPEGAVKQWLDKLAEADAYVIVTPEYNRSVPGPLKNAIDFIDFQVAKKPIGLVAHGVTGGAQSVAHLRGIIPGVLAVSVPEVTYFSDRVAEHIDDDGVLSQELQDKAYGPLSGVRTTLAETVWYGQTLKAARDNG